MVSFAVGNDSCIEAGGGNASPTSISAQPSPLLARTTVDGLGGGLDVW